MDKLQKLEKKILERISFNLQCRATADHEGRRETALHFHFCANEDMEILDMLLHIADEEEKGGE